ncbi:inositol monophosphatase [Aeoliella sp. ICT_H6.2]|uniref:Inositol-1-monophosphatase n=1 Tax=Aeoliella straminimaris TaxID=2954799 RepID=A0A9X2FHU7_9BACT|nr:inositol monophosphatase family protein [Aeoliella straminimaris]MCO6047194.1 inositol monophosphatase [Aeoliella straminimaris]
MYSAIDSPHAELLEVAVEAAKAGGAKLLEWRGKFKTREKSPADLVTDADLASQKAIAEVVAHHYPDHAFLGEENPGDIRPLLSQPHCWVVDPLDGTTNYVHDFPAFAVSVAVTTGGELAAGVIYDPLHERVYAAARGGGAWLGDEPIRVRTTEQLSDALVAMSLPPQAKTDSPDVLDFVSMVGRCRAIRRLGSAALNLAYVAQGVLDAHWARYIHPWDVAAGVLLVREAGGIVTASDGGEFDLASAHLVAAAPGVQDDLVQVLQQSGARPVNR